MDLPKYAYFQNKIVPYSEAKVGVLTHALNYGTAVFVGAGVAVAGVAVNLDVALGTGV